MADQQFWTSFYNMATHAGAKYPELLAAQASLESGWGEHVSGKNNYFGIKGSPGTVVSTQEWVNGEFITIRDEFKDFDHKFDCVRYLVDRWYKDYKGYKGVNRGKDREEAAYLLKEEGYATDPSYPEKLIDLMDRMQPAEEAASQGDGYFLINAAVYYNAEPHQIEAWQMLEDNLEPELLEAFKTAYRNEVKEDVLINIPLDPEEAPQAFPLPVPYYNQYDSATSHGHRMCFSSSMTMALDYLDPEKIEGDDDWYLNVVFNFGDTVSAEAQVAAARSLGFEAEMHYDGTQAVLDKLLDDGIPVPVGILHKGPVDSPNGGGHWICLTGHTDSHYYVNDPAGDLDLIGGGYPGSGDGEQLLYSKKNLLKRWLIDDSGSDGWYMDLSGNF